MARWKLVVWACLVAVLGGVSTRSIWQSTAVAGQRPTGRLTQSPVRWIAVRQLAHGTLPNKQTYAIVGERYRFQRRVYFTLAVSIDRPGLPPGGGGGGSFNPSQTPGTLAYTALVACAPHPYAIVFGLLRASSDTVVARQGSRNTVLRHISIPAVLHVHGVLAYARLVGAPSEVIVKRPDGTRILGDKLGGGSCAPGMVIVLQAQAHPQVRSAG